RRVFIYFKKMSEYQKINYYKVLRLTHNTTIQKIKQAYKKLALLYHPDKNIKKSEKEHQQAEQRFIEI
ncbi:23758_t:CDS:1, partial [Gigaspora margarita]